MKRLSFIIMPMLALTLLASCGANDYQVNEEGFTKALKFTDVKYMQTTAKIEVADPQAGTSLSYDISGEFSPTVFHSIEVNTYKKGAEIYELYDEEFIVKNSDNTYDSYWRTSRDGEYSKKKTEAKYFKTPEQLELMTQLTENGLTYKSFTFNKDKGNKYFSTPYKVGEVDIYTVLSFNKGKLISCNEEDGQGVAVDSTTYAYEEKTPQIPQVAIA